jgi:hypothetical protein
MELRRRLKFMGPDKFFISEMLDLSSDRSDFMEEAFISLEDVKWCTLCEDDVEQDDLATRELDVEDELLACIICEQERYLYLYLPRHLQAIWPPPNSNTLHK